MGDMTSTDCISVDDSPDACWRASITEKSVGAIMSAACTAAVCHEHCSRILGDDDDAIHQQHHTRATQSVQHRRTKNEITEANTGYKANKTDD